MPHDGLTLNRFPNKGSGPLTAAGIHTTTTVKSQAVTYPFVDLIRFVATIGIVYIHTEFNLTNENSFYHKVPHIEYYFYIRQLFKFSTICYFMIAGFLLGDKIEDHTQRLKYFIRRVNVIAKPYLLALVLFILAFILNRSVSQKLSLTFLFETCRYILCYTAFWYIPNFLICLLVMVCCSKYLKSVYFGVLLLFIGLCFSYYSVYSPTHTSSHTTAIFGFTFYMWLGLYIKKAGIIDKIQQLSPWLLGGILVSLYILSNYETWYLFYYTHTRDCLNTLRISNQLYSVAMFAFLVRICAKAPSFGIFRPKQETYGIYLYHSFFIFFILPAIESWLAQHHHITLFSYNVYKIIAFNVVSFFVSYFAATIIVKALIRFKLAWLPYEN